MHNRNEKMENIIKIQPLGWEWYCPKCTTTNTISRHEYIVDMPVQCQDCGTNFDNTEKDIY